MARPNPSLDASINRRKFLKVAGGTTLATAAFLAGCGGTSTASNGSKITLQHWYSTPGEVGAPEAAVRYAQEYTKLNPNVEIKVTMIPSNYTTKLATALLSPKAPDVFQTGPAPTLDQVKAGLVAPLDDLYTSSVKADFHPQDLQALTLNNHIYGVKTLEDFSVIYYRKSLLAKAGVGVPSTLDELTNAAKAMTTSKVKGLFVGNSTGARPYVYYVQAPFSAGVKLIDDQTKQVSFKTDKMAAVLSKYRALETSGALLDGAPTDCFDPGAFVSGLCAMQWGGMWEMPAILKQWGDDVGVFAFPSLDATVPPGVWYAGWSNSVSAKSPNVNEAKKYVKWLGIDNTQIQIDWNTGYGFHVPPRVSVAAQATKLKSGVALEAVQLFQQYAEVTSPLWDGKMYTALAAAISNAVQQGKDPMSELNTAYQVCVQELQQELG
jgi:multiple sugar transport system substrate-binding protein